MYGAKQVTRAEVPLLYDVVEKLANKANLPMPKVYVINDETPNAYCYR
jgi:heat shock protein HtpX